MTPQRSSGQIWKEEFSSGQLAPSQTNVIKRGGGGEPSKVKEV